MIEWCGNYDTEGHKRKSAKAVKRRARSRHEGHRGVSRDKSGRIRCRSCDEKRRSTEEYRNYQREYQRKAREDRQRVREESSWERLMSFVARRGGRYTVQELAELLEISQETIKSWCRRGWIDYEIEKNDTGVGVWRTRRIILL